MATFTAVHEVWDLDLLESWEGYEPPKLQELFVEGANYWRRAPMQAAQGAKEATTATASSMLTGLYAHMRWLHLKSGETAADDRIRKRTIQMLGFSMLTAEIFDAQDVAISATSTPEKASLIPDVTPAWIQGECPPYALHCSPSLLELFEESDAPEQWYAGSHGLLVRRLMHEPPSPALLAHPKIGGNAALFDPLITLQPTLQVPPLKQ